MGNCMPCGLFSPSYQRVQAEHCVACGGFCSSWGLLAQNDTSLFESQGYAVEKVETEDGPIAVISSSSPVVVTSDVEPFISIEEVKEIGKINAHAAIILLHFNPDYFTNIPFIKGSGGSPHKATSETLQLVINKENDPDLYKSVSIPLEEGKYIDMTWELNKESNVWVFKTMIRDEEGAAYGAVYPDIEVSVTPDRPYRMTGWRIAP